MQYYRDRTAIDESLIRAYVSYRDQNNTKYIHLNLKMFCVKKVIRYLVILIYWDDNHPIIRISYYLLLHMYAIIIYYCICMQSLFTIAYVWNHYLLLHMCAIIIYYCICVQSLFTIAYVCNQQ